MSEILSNIEPLKIAKKTDTIEKSKNLLLLDIQQTFPKYTGDLMNIEELTTYLNENGELFIKFIETKITEISSRDELFAYLYKSDEVTPYQKKQLQYIDKRSKGMKCTIIKGSNDTNAHGPSKSVSIGLGDIVLISALGNISFDASLALSTIHEYNHIFNNYIDSGFSSNGLGIMSDPEDEHEKDSLRREEQENSRKTEERYKIAYEYHKISPYNDFFRFSQVNKNYIINSKDEFLTESVSNEHFMERLSHISYENKKSRYDTIIKNNLKESGIDVKQNTLLYTLHDFYYGNLNKQARKLQNKDMGAQFYAYEERESA